ncbi:unnamed protein product, partial [Ixodes hexagonus]
QDSSVGSELAKSGGAVAGSAMVPVGVAPPGVALVPSGVALGGGAGQQSQQQQLALKDVQCPICLKVFSRKFSLEMHFLIHQGLKPYKCQFCGRCFRQKGTLMRHKAIHSQTPSYRCGLCDKSYRQKNVFLHHLRNRHKVSTDVLDRRRCHIKNNNSGGGGGLMEALPPSTAPYPPPLPPPSMGSVCLPPLSPPEPLAPPQPGGGVGGDGGGSQEPPIILRISERQQSMPPLFSGNPVPPPPLHLAPPGPPAPWQCPFCAFESVHDPDVCRSHLLQHVEDPPPAAFLDCPLCPRRIGSPAELAAHLRDFHESSGGGASPLRGAGPRGGGAIPEDARSSDVTFSCIPCQMEFGSEDDFEWHVKTHVQSVLSEGDGAARPSDDCAGPLDLTEARGGAGLARGRSGERVSERGQGRRQLMCVECGKLFGSKALYRYHAQLHLAVQGAFRCPQCRLRFARKPQLLQHTRQCHLRRLRCPSCGRLFSYRCLLASHARHCPGPAPPPLCLPVVDIEAARGALGTQLLGVIPLVAPDGDEPSSVLGVPVLAPDSLLKNRLNGLHVSARIGL